MDVAITIDVEHDCPPFLETWRGIEGGMPRLLDLFAAEGVRATFFTTGAVARRYPDVVRAVVDGGHELGCHGDTHRRFGAMDQGEARREIEAANQALRAFGPVVSFRAPNLDLPAPYLRLLAEAGYRVDSSQGRHKRGSLFVRPSRVDGVVRIPASMAPSAMRLPSPIRSALLGSMRDPVVLFFHPWEFVDVTREPIPLDCRFWTGDVAVRKLRDTIRWLKGRGAGFFRMNDLAKKLTS